MKTFLGSNLKFLRRMKGYTQTELADIVEVKRSKIASYESAVVEPQFHILLKLAQALDTTVTEMLTVQLEQNILEVFEEPSAKSASSTAYYTVTPEIKKFIESTNNGQKTIDGFQALYEFNRLNQSGEDMSLSALHAELDQLVSLVNSLLKVNWEFIQSIQEGTEEEE